MKLKGLSFKRVVGRTKLLAAKVSPSAAITFGVVGMVGTAVLASRATLKAQSVVEDHKKMIDDTLVAYKEFKDKKDDNGILVYSEEDFKRDQIVAWSKTAVAMMKLYAPSVALGVVSISAIMYGRNQFKGRLAAVSAAYQLAEASLTRYRDTVRDEVGDDKEYELFSRTISKMDKEDDSDEAQAVVAPKTPSCYARFFDENSTVWRKNALENRLYLHSQQNYFNDLLVSRGHVFLNEVYDALGLERTSSGQVVGWVLDRNKEYNYIDFGIFDGDNIAKRAFVNGDERSVLLDFNVDGIIYDLI